MRSMRTSSILAILCIFCGCVPERERAAPIPAKSPPPPDANTPPVRLLARATFDETEPPDVIRPAFSADGLGGRALCGAAGWQMPATGRFELAEGTVEFRLRFDRPAAQIQSPGWTLFRCRPPGPPDDSYANGFNVIHGWGGGLFLLVGDLDGRQAMLRYNGTGAWTTGEWHHCAFTWRVSETGRSSLAFYVDDRLVERRAGVNLRLDLAAWETALAATGASQLVIRAGSVWGQPAPGAIDDIRIYNRIRHYEVAP